MTLKELSPEIQKAFREDDQRVRINNSIGGCWLAITLMPAGFTLDYFVYPDQLWSFLELRLLCSLLVGGVLALFYTPFGKRHYRVLGQIWYLLPALCIAAMIYLTEGASSPYYAGLNIVLIAVGFMLPWTYLENLWAGTAVMLIYLAACYFQGPLVLKGEFFNNLYFLVLTDVIVVTGSYFSGQLRLREFVLRYELDRNRNFLEESNRKLVEMDQMKTRFFANISHELRTPLTLLISPLEELARSQGLGPQAKETLGLMQANAMRLLKLINDLLDLAKLESGRMEVRKEPVEVEGFLKGICLSVQGTAKDKGIKIECNVQEGLGSPLVDRDKLEKILLNLVFNSIKFTPAGGQVSASVEVKEGRLVFQVADTGMGIGPQDLPHIFDRFWQADSSAKRKYQGTGIGLSLVKELTEAQAGLVGAQSVVGRGTTITVSLPLEKAEGPTTEGKEDEKAPQSEGPQAQWLEKLYRRAELFPSLPPLAGTIRHDDLSRARRPRVLIADDEPDMLRFLKSQMEKDYDVLEAVDGQQALEKARQFLPNLVLLDMMMPEKDGITVCRELKEAGPTRSIPVLMLTARADEATKFSALEAGANDFLTKPFSGPELKARVRNLIESLRFQRELAVQKNALESAMEQLKETEATLVQTEKMSSLGRMSAGMIHEINNPLNYALAALSVLDRQKEKWPEADRSKLSETLADIREGMVRVQRIVSDLREFTHPHGRALGPIDLEETITTALRFLGHEAEKTAQIVLTVPKNQQVFSEKNNLTHVFVNLFQNAMDAMRTKDYRGEKPSLTVGSEVKGGRVWVSVRDNGPGIDPGHLDKIFDPFFTTKDVGEGMGLGLSICYRIMKDLGGSISARSETGKFTEFLLDLPEQGPSGSGT
jgi:signal transduction histidine kinase